MSYPMEAPLPVGAGKIEDYVKLYSEIQKVLESDSEDERNRKELELETYFEKIKRQDDELRKYKTFGDFVNYVRQGMEGIGPDEEESACDCC